ADEGPEGAQSPRLLLPDLVVEVEAAVAARHPREDADHRAGAAHAERDDDVLAPAQCPGGEDSEADQAQPDEHAADVEDADRLLAGPVVVRVDLRELLPALLDGAPYRRRL